MFHKEWEILLVDDEPDVLSISKLAMRNFEVYDIPLKIYTAESKAEAIEILSEKPEMDPVISVAFIDVVMETDTAGLELCQHIREDMGNKLTQLFIRTGQPGIAPEREVIDRYDISGYFTKVEATEDRLYSLVKSGVRQYLWAKMSLGSTAFLSNMIEAASVSREKFEESLQPLFQAFFVGRGDTPVDSLDVHVCVLIGDRMVAGIGWDEKTAIEVRDNLNQLEGTPLSPNGDTFVRDESNNQVIKVVSQPEFYFLFRRTFTPPDYTIAMLHRLVVCAALLWQQAK